MIISEIELLLIGLIVLIVIFVIILFRLDESWYKTLCEQNEDWYRAMTEMNESWSDFYKKLLNSKDIPLKEKEEIKELISFTCSKDDGDCDNVTGNCNDCKYMEEHFK